VTSFYRYGEGTVKTLPRDAEGVKHFFEDMNELIPKQMAESNRYELVTHMIISASEYLRGLIKAADWRLRRFWEAIGTREP